MKFFRVTPYLIIAMLCGSCASPRNQITPQEQSTTGATSPAKTGCSLVSSDSPSGLRKAWEALLAEGRYRLPQSSEFMLPIDQRPWPCHFGWKGELFAIVVDTTRSDNSRFKLVLLVPPKTESGSYKLHWVLHNHDLSHAILSNASSNLVVYEYLDGGGQRNSTLKWDKKKNAYVAIGRVFA